MQMNSTKPGKDSRKFSIVPEYMQSLPQWVLWRYVDRGGAKPTKVPFQPNGRNASSDNKSTWSNFGDVVQRYEAGDFDGIGFVVAEGDGLFGADLDNCLVNGQVLPWAQEVMQSLQSYTEVSPSGNGLRIFGYGKPLATGRKKWLREGTAVEEAVEVYDFSSPRYLTVTGNVFGMQQLTDCQNGLEHIFEKYFAQKRSEPNLIRDQHGQVNLELVQNALSFVPADDYSTWIEIGHALKAAGVPFEIWDHWSQTSDKYVDGECERKWAHMQPNRIGLGTVFHHAKQHGFRFRKLVSFSTTDIGNAERFVEQFGDELRWSADQKKWLLWDGRRWKATGDERALALAKRTAKRISEELAECTSDEQRAKLSAWAKISSNAARLDAMLKLAKPELLIEPDELDCHPFKLNCLNGTVDLRTGLLMPHRQSDFITKLASVPYEPSAQAPRFQQFMRETFGGSTGLISFVQVALGYSLTGSVVEQKLFVCYGDGQNGKSTIFNAIRELMGDYAQEASPGILEVRPRAGGHSEEVARLKGVRLVTTIELNDGVKLDEAKAKQLTGSDTLAARHMYGHTFEFSPTHKLFVISNYLPSVPARAKGMWRRIRLIPFNHQVPEHKKDKHLPDRLRDEYAGILAWLVQGCLRWQEEGLSEPPEVENATNSFRSEMDSVAKFIRDFCRTDVNGKVQASQLRERYHQWCMETGELELSPKDFAADLIGKGFESRKRGVNMWLGLSLIPVGEESVSSTG